MKKLALTLASITFMLFPTKGQLILNPGFELVDIESTTHAEQWETPSKKSNISIDSSVVYSGKYSLRIQSKEQISSSFKQTITHSAEKFQKCRLSAWIKLDSVKLGYGSLWVRITDIKNNRNYIDGGSLRLEGTCDWKFYSIDFYLDGSARDITLGGILTGPGFIWFDNLKIDAITDTSHYSQIAFNYMQEVFPILDEYSLWKDSIDFQKLKLVSIENLNGAKTIEDCHPMVRYIIGKLEDNHSHFMSPIESKNYSQNSDLIQSEGKLLQNKFAYIILPKVLSTDSLATVGFASTLQNIIKNLDNSSPLGWIVDLRENNGGNCFPMLAGIGPLIGDDVCVYMFSTTDPPDFISYRQGSVFYNDTIPVISTSTEPYTLKNEVPIAVLIGPKTGSSGELVAISFIGKPSCKLFGEPSAGATTGNAFFPLSDGSAIILTITVQADRNLKRYGGKIQPDFLIDFTDRSYDENNDPVIEAAIQWIKEINK
jgi:hypothetical protein